MRSFNVLATTLMLVAVWQLSASAQAVFYSPNIATYPAQVNYALPVVVVPPVQVITAYRPVVPTVVAPANFVTRGSVYSTSRPVYPVYAAAYPVVSAAPVSVYGVASGYRAGVVGPGLGGSPRVYSPGQPVRNAIRYVVP